ncbi:hypothetical protein [Micromonospora pattaloongensis]|nr:hypothetical protein [Micromonospora pattaloongensis]
MNDFFVDPPGLSGLYNILVRAADHADDTLQYTTDPCQGPADHSDDTRYGG